jgi:hypothetical protein
MPKNQKGNPQNFICPKNQKEKQYILGEKVHKHNLSHILFDKFYITKNKSINHIFLINPYQ